MQQGPEREISITHGIDPDPDIQALVKSIPELDKKSNHCYGEAAAPLCHFIPWSERVVSERKNRGV